MTDRTRVGITLVSLFVLLALALPVLAAPPSTPPGQANKAEKSKVPEVEVSLRGRVEKSTDAEGETTYTLTADGRTWRLEAGPKWFHGDSHPLEDRKSTRLTPVTPISRMPSSA